ncbi:GNAT family N-acetyltransferase [Sphingomonas sp. ID1715]|uniref:GNAT family N-acetyltransferase n=1 Tax=Sphingomonas sp. ID1715 TaxID=1656898 RepID=UPI00148A0CAD|nr:GNAT family N-acetyltransferase [Sphingomonas sp. ID1715]NNM76024.1 GNAT family N-acetyltransferase [Sphingomonas sp. ID1715]
MTQAIEYRDAVPEDGRELDAMAQAVWLETFGHSGSAEDIGLYLAKAYGPNGDLIRHLNDPDHRFRLALQNEAIVGYAKLSKPWLPREHVGPRARQLSQIYIVGSARGSGVANTLMDWAIETARAESADELLLTVWEHNPRAMRFYEKLGFMHIGDFEFPMGNQIDRDLIMRLPL